MAQKVNQISIKVDNTLFKPTVTFCYEGETLASLFMCADGAILHVDGGEFGIQEGDGPKHSFCPAFTNGVRMREFILKDGDEKKAIG